MYDVAIIGNGPAAFSAAINALQRNKSTVVLGKGIHSSWLYKAEKVDNYLGMPGQTGRKMLEHFCGHAQALGCEFIFKRVLQIMSIGNRFAMNAENQIVEARSVVLATGAPKGNELLPGEKELLGRGVSYCATCDGMLYKGRTVALVGGLPDAEEDANFLGEICSHVYYLPLYENIGTLREGIEIITEKPVAVKGDSMVAALELPGREIPCDGVFIIKESVPIDSLVHGLDIEAGAIMVDREMRTNVEGIFAAGDCTGKPLQVSKAVGEGLIAAQSAVRYLDAQKK